MNRLVRVTLVLAASLAVTIPAQAVDDVRGWRNTTWKMSESPSPITVSFMAERTVFAAPGLAGGGAGGKGDVRINGRSVDNRRQHLIGRGDRILVRTPGGGGYGSPLERDPALVRRDVVRGYLTAEDAERDYGVVLRGAPVGVDVEATARRRAARAGR